MTKIKEKKLSANVCDTAVIRRYNAILEAIPDILVEVNENKIYTWANMAGYEFFGDEIIGKEAKYYFEGEQKTYQMVDRLFKGSEDIFYLESWQRRKDGKKRLLAWWCRSLKDDNGQVIGALSSARDITELKENEGKLQSYTKELEKINAELNRFKQIAIGRELRMVELKKLLADCQQGQHSS